jgi:hypothetical protein
MAAFEGTTLQAVGWEQPDDARSVKQCERSSRHQAGARISGQAPRGHSAQLTRKPE